MMSESQLLNPLYDPNKIDPDHEAIRKLVGHFDKFGYSVGNVCDVFELCGHLVCQASVDLWVAIEQTKKALNGEELTL